MMHRLLLRTFKSMALMLAALPCACFGQVTIHALVKSAGVPQPNIGIVVQTRNGSKASGVTDAAGKVSVSVTPDAGDRVVSVRVSAGGEDAFSPEQLAKLQLALNNWLDGNCIKAKQTVPLVPGTDEYSIQFDAAPCVFISGRVITPQGEPVICVGVAADIGNREFAPALQYRAPVVQGSPATLILSTDAGVYLRRLTPQQTAADVMLPDIVEALPSEVGACTVRLNDWLPFAKLTITDSYPTATLISLDGSRIASAGDSRGEKLPGGQHVIRAYFTRVPPGEYYLVTGAPFSPGAIALLDAIARGDDLSQSGIPRVTIVANQTVEVDLDMPVVHKILFNMRKP